MGNFKMNLFEHYRQEGCLPIENNISRIFARILKDNMHIFNDFISKVDDKTFIVLGGVESEYNVDFQKAVSDIDVDCYNYVIGVALTAEELQDVEAINTEVNRHLITDIVIENFKDILIIIEVKRTNENCMYQLDKQIQSIIEGKDIKYDKVSLKWEDIVDILENYLRTSKKQDVIVEDYYDYLKYHYKQWFPVVSLQNCNNAEFINKRIERLLQNIQMISGNDFKIEGKWLKVPNWGWTNQIEIVVEDDENLSLKIWPGDSGQQFYKLMPKTSLKFVTQPEKELIIQIKDLSIPVKSFIQPYLKVSNAFGGWMASGDLNKQYYLDKRDYEKIFYTLHGKWNRDEELNDFVKDGRSFLNEIKELKLLNKTDFIEKIQSILNNTKRMQISISLGFYVELKIPLEELRKVDENFSSKNDIDELAEPIYKFIINYRNLIES